MAKICRCRRTNWETKVIYRCKSKIEGNCRYRVKYLNMILRNRNQIQIEIQVVIILTCQLQTLFNKTNHKITKNINKISTKWTPSSIRSSPKIKKYNITKSDGKATHPSKILGNHQRILEISCIWFMHLNIFIRYS